MTIKKTMVAALAFVTENGNMSAENLAKFTADYCAAKSGSGESKPREIVRLYDADGEILGGRCSSTLLWFAIDNFNKHHGIAKQTQNAKSRLATEAKLVETEAKVLLDEAREVTDAAEKLELFEQYDVKMLEAKEIRSTPVTTEMFTEEVPYFETIEELADDLGVEVITTKPKTEAEAEEE